MKKGQTHRHMCIKVGVKDWGVHMLIEWSATNKAWNLSVCIRHNARGGVSTSQ